jgi:DNA-nicking Smr family endonuclease
MTADDSLLRRRKLTADERALWGRVTRALTPLKRRRAASDRVDEDAAEHITKAVPSRRAEPAAARGPSPAQKPAPGLAPLDRRLKQRLARGSEPIDARLDLHGRTQGEAHAALLRFLRRA